MNDRKLNQLFQSARKSAPPVPEAGFENLVLSAIHRVPAPAPTSLFDQLAAALPRVAWAAAAMIVVCIGIDIYLTAGSSASLSERIAQLSEQWLFAVN